VSWEPISWDALGERPPVTPSIGGLVYPGRRHVFSGPPESAKTWAAFCLAAEVIGAGGTVLHVDFEMFAYETRDRFRDLGLNGAQLDRVVHVEPEVRASEQTTADLVEEYEPRLVVIDAAAGAYALHGLDDNKRQDAEAFDAALIAPFRARGVATVLLDHVTKNTETRGRFSIGSERKIGGADVHLGFDAAVPFGRGRTGLVNITTHKDRFGYLPRPRAAELELRSDPLTGAVAWSFRTASESGDDWRPTGLMEKVSRYLVRVGEEVSRGDVEKNVTGKAKYLRDAIDALVADGFAAEREGARGSRLLRSVKPFSEVDLVPTSSRPNTADLVPTSSRPEPLNQADNATSSQLVPTSSRLRDGLPRPVVPSPPGGTASGTRSSKDENEADVPLLGDPGYPLLLDRVYANEQLTEAELRGLLTLHRAVRQA